MSAYYPYAGTLTNTPQPYRKQTISFSESFTLPSNTAAFLVVGGGFVLTLPDGTSVDYTLSPPTYPISIEAIYPKGDFIITASAGEITVSLYAHA